MITHTYTDGAAVMSAVGRVIHDDSRLAFRVLQAAIGVECPERIPLPSPGSDRRDWAVSIPDGGVAVVRTGLFEAFCDLSLSIEVDVESRDAVRELYRAIVDRMAAMLAPERQLSPPLAVTTNEEVHELPF